MTGIARFRALVLAAAGALALAGSAGAATLIDFTDRSRWNGSGGGATSAVDYGWFTAMIATSPGDAANFTEDFDGPQSSPYCQANGGPLACQSDGLGLGDDEISAGQFGDGELQPRPRRDRPALPRPVPGAARPRP